VRVTLAPWRAGGAIQAIVTLTAQVERDLKFGASEFDVPTVLRIKFMVKEKFDERWQGSFLQRMFHLDRPI